MLPRSVVPDFTCQECGRRFELSEQVLTKYPGWAPKTCMRCRQPAKKASNASRRLIASIREENLTTAEVLRKYSGGPTTGVFTDGAAEPNPGPGGWGVVHVENDRIITEEFGHDPKTTSNRMELLALSAALRIVPPGKPVVIYSDSLLCVNTFTLWARSWEARGWKRKDGEIKNLDLVKDIYGVLKQRKDITLQWIKAHAGNRWNEYADSLATAYRRSVR
jgi:ribonuclease HI